jgi:hypothetical protein
MGTAYESSTAADCGAPRVFELLDFSARASFRARAVNVLM